VRARNRRWIVKTYTVGYTSREEFMVEIEAENEAQARQLVKSYGKDAEGVLDWECVMSGEDIRIFDVELVDDGGEDA